MTNFALMKYIWKKCGGTLCLDILRNGAIRFSIDMNKEYYFRNGIFDEIRLQGITFYEVDDNFRKLAEAYMCEKNPNYSYTLLYMDSTLIRIPIRRNGKKFDNIPAFKYFHAYREYLNNMKQPVINEILNEA